MPSTIGVSVFGIFATIILFRYNTPVLYLYILTGNVRMGRWMLSTYSDDNKYVIKLHTYIICSW